MDRKVIKLIFGSGVPKNKYLFFELTLIFQNNGKLLLYTWFRHMCEIILSYKQRRSLKNPLSVFQYHQKGLLGQCVFVQGCFIFKYLQTVKGFVTVTKECQILKPPRQLSNFVTSLYPDLNGFFLNYNTLFLQVNVEEFVPSRKHNLLLQ